MLGPTLESTPRGGLQRAGPLSEPDKWVNADSGLNHSQTELGLKFK